mgnify:CR=1 FL=1
MYLEIPFAESFEGVKLQNTIFFESFPEQTNLVVARFGAHDAAQAADPAEVRVHALAVARERALEEVRELGLTGRNLPTLRIYTSEHAHSSVEKAAIALGIGEKNVCRVVTDSEFRLDPDALRRMINDDRARNFLPIAVVATVGTTSTASVDPVAAISQIARAEKLWLHIDAAYGGGLALLPEAGWVTENWSSADSLVINPHKMLFVPFDFSALYLRDIGQLRDLFSLVPEYLRGDTENSVTNYMDYGVQLGRRFRALKAWLVFRQFGRAGLAEAIRAHIGSIFQAFIDGDEQKIFATHSEDWRGLLEGTRTPIRGIDEYMRANGIDWPKPANAPKSHPYYPAGTTHKIGDFDVHFYSPELAVASFFGEFQRNAITLRRFRIMDVYAKRNGSWIQVASHTVVDPEWRAEQMSKPMPIAPETRPYLEQYPLANGPNLGGGLAALDARLGADRGLPAPLRSIADFSATCGTQVSNGRRRAAHQSTNAATLGAATGRAGPPPRHRATPATSRGRVPLRAERGQARCRSLPATVMAASRVARRRWLLQPLGR